MWVRGVRRDYDDIPLGNNIDIDCTLVLSLPSLPQPADLFTQQIPPGCSSSSSSLMFPFLRQTNKKKTISCITFLPRKSLE